MKMKMKIGRIRTMNEERHFLDLARSRVSMLLRFSKDEIACSIDIPKERLLRRHRRALKKWVDSIITPLEADPRPMKMVTTQGGIVVSLGFEFRGIVCCIQSLGALENV